MLKLTALTKSFNQGTPNEKTAIDCLNLVVKNGDFVTIIGGNGAGKSTLLSLVAGVFPPDAGSVIIDERNVTRLAEHKRARYIGRVFQDPMMGTAADMTIEENLALALRRGEARTLRWGITATERKRYQEVLSDLGLGLESRLTSRIGLLSGGQRQALTLLMATLKTPKMLLLDEHTAALDPKTAATVLSLTDKYVSQTNLTTLMVTHNMKHALQYGNRLLMMHAGKIVVDVFGEAKQILKVDDLLRLFERNLGEELTNDRMLLS